MIFNKITQFLSLVKFSHTIFALPFAAIGFALGVQESSAPSLMLAIKILLCMLFARNAAMAFNRFVDRFIDAKNPRTLVREIPAGIIKAQSVLLFTIFNSVAFIITTYFINIACFYLSFVALAVVLGYSYTKLFTPLCHFVLGLGLSLAPIGAYLAVTGHFNIMPIFFAAIVFFWVSGFDVVYALQDVDFDLQQRLKSIPVLLGKQGALMFARICHFICSILVIVVGLYKPHSYLYMIGACLFILLLIYQHRLVKANDLSRIDLAFFTTNGIGSIVFGAFVIADVFLEHSVL